MKTGRDSHVHGKPDRGLEHSDALYPLLRNSPGQHCLLTTGSPYILIPESFFSLRCSIPGHSLTEKVKMKLKILSQAPHIRSKDIVHCSFVGLPCLWNTYEKKKNLNLSTNIFVFLWYFCLYGVSSSSAMLLSTDGGFATYGNKQNMCLSAAGAGLYSKGSSFCGFFRK